MAYMAKYCMIMSGLGARIKSAADLIGGLNKLADALSVPRRTLGNWVDGSTEPKASAIVAIANATGSSVVWVLTGNGEMLPGEERVISGTVPDGFIRLPQFDVNASAGRGEIAYREHPVNEVTFERRFLREIGAQPDSCHIMWAKGDSMQPTFPDGAMLIVDQSQQIVDDGRIYVFNADGNLLVKRARWRFDGRLELVSDNVAGNYPIETFAADRIVDLIVVGRVVWYGRTA
ncbi:S24 family peptidase [Ciceribacter sp. sgz301302]